MTIIYFRGCTGREKEKNIVKATEKLLKACNVDYKLLGDEKCCGSVLLRTGFTDEANNLIKMNSNDFKGETILTSCAGCYKTLKTDYENIDVIHISQFLLKLIDEGKLNLNKKDIDVTYHDPCHLSRHCKEFDAPRNVIEKIANLKEMENIKDNAQCCGAGGGVKSAFGEISEDIAKKRLKEAENTNAKYLLTSCPFCKLNLKDKSPIKILDITEFLEMVGLNE